MKISAYRKLGHICAERAQWNSSVEHAMNEEPDKLWFDIYAILDAI